EMRVRLAQHVTFLTYAEATEALAKLAVFSPEDKVRQAALPALAKRPKEEITVLLLNGLQYPWPAVAEHAAQAVAHLKRTDLIPQLVDLLDQPDPREPAIKEIRKKKVSAVRELVRINHHRNCLLCHSPANDPDVTSDEHIVSGAVPLPT